MKGIFKRNAKSAVDSVTNYISNYYYDKIKSQYSRLDTYKRLASIDKEFTYYTNNSIDFSQHSDFLKSPKQFIVKKYGKPDHTISTNQIIGNITILIYRICLGGHKTTLELHFFKDHLIMYTYRFSYLTKMSEKQHLIDLLRNKYHINSVMTPNKHCIKNDQHRMIYITDNVDFSINYLNFFQTGFLKTIDSKLDEVQQTIRMNTIRREHELSLQL